MIDLSQKELRLVYPCSWVYKIITAHDAHDIAQAILQDLQYKVVFSKRSKKEKYDSYNIEVEVLSQAHRQNLYEKFRAHPNVKIVL